MTKCSQCGGVTKTRPRAVDGVISGKGPLDVTFNMCPTSDVDPGDQLKRVLAFRQDQENARDLLYKEFADTDDWVRQFREWLTTYIAKRIKEKVEIETGAGRAQESEPATHDRQGDGVRHPSVQYDDAAGRRSAR